MTEPNPWQTLASKTVYQNPWIRVREDQVITPAGDEGIYGVIEANNSVMIVALNENDEIYIIRSFRYPTSSWNWELPGGGGDQQHPIEAAARELEEETGIVAEEWEQLGTTWVCNGLLTESTTTCLARTLTLTDQPTDKNEPLQGAKFVSLSELDEMIARGEINDNQSITAFYLLKRWMETHQQYREAL